MPKNKTLTGRPIYTAVMDSFSTGCRDVIRYVFILLLTE